MRKNTPDITVQHLYQQIKDLLVQARTRVFQAVNSEMVVCYWNIGRLIVEEEQLIEILAGKLATEFGRGFDKSNLWNMRAFGFLPPGTNFIYQRKKNWPRKSAKSDSG
jgi:hypothetical protein